MKMCQTIIEGASLVSVSAGLYKIPSLPRLEGINHSDQVWCSMRHLASNLSSTRGRPPMLSSFRPEYLFAGQTSFNWVSTFRDGKLMFTTHGNIAECPFNMPASMGKVLLPTEWADEVRNLASQGIFAFACADRVVLADSSVVSYTPGRNYHKYVLEAAA